MVKGFIAFSLMAVILGTTASAQAEDQLMVLWPKQRASHQVTIDDQAASYKARGADYVNHTYETGGETPMDAPSDAVLHGDGALADTELQPVPINIGQVADIVKDTEAKDAAKNPPLADGYTSFSN